MRQVLKCQSTHLIHWCIALVALAMLAGCSQPQEPSPPVIYFGQHECDVCRMIISDDRYAAALVHVDDRGRFMSMAFDDIGCLLELEQEQEGQTLQIVARYVTDAETGQWLDASDATYLHSKSLRTPMAYYLAALPDRNRAAAMQQEHPGDILTFEQVRQRHAARALRDFATHTGGHS